MKVTELEGVILGVVASRQPCSAYAIRQRFERSPTWGWSSSKGAIYPAVKRLVARSLLKGAHSAQGKRRSQQLVLTAKGKIALAAWISGLAPEMAGAPVDPIRARVSYLSALAPAERNEFLDRAEHEVRLALKAAKRLQLDPETCDRWGLEASWLGVRMQIEAKLAWLQAVRKLIEGQGAA